MSRRRAFLVADLGYGDSGKGTVVDWLTEIHAADLVVRTNGGPQAGHNVVRHDGRHHTFAQFGSGSFRASTRTLLADPMLIEPYALLNEAAHLREIDVADPLARTTIDARCRVILPPHQVANRIRERARGAAAHGTCGLGVGEAVADAIDRPDLTLRAGDLSDADAVRRILHAVMAAKHETLRPLMAFASPPELRVLTNPAWIEVAVAAYADVARRCHIASPPQTHVVLRAARCVVFEGAQGVLLDETFGFAPHTTWSDTTFRPAEALLAAAAFDGDLERIGVMRTYATRHGAGPLVTEQPDLIPRLPEPHNGDAGFQGPFRRGPLDLVSLQYALDALGGDLSLAVTHLDRLPLLPAIACDGYVLDGTERPPLAAPVAASDLLRLTPRYRSWPMHDADAFVSALENSTGRRVGLRSSGSTWKNKTWSRFR